MTTIPVLTRFSNLSKELANVLPHLKFKDITPETASELKDSRIIIADFDLIGPYIHNLPNTKWIQATWAGIEWVLPYIDFKKVESLPLVTRFSGQYYGRLMTEYVIAHIVNYERDNFRSYECKKQKTWYREGKVLNHRCIGDLVIGVMGIGSIGSKICGVLHDLGGTVLGYGRQPQIDPSKTEFISKYYTKPSLNNFLKEVDYFINVLPSTSETIGLLDGDVLKNCEEKKPVFINIGRGSIINENDLVKALNNKWLSGAILDVFAEEPLPKESPLWTMSQVVITPHVSGVVRAKDLAQQFKENMELFENNMPISTTVDFTRHY